MPLISKEEAMDIAQKLWETKKSSDTKVLSVDITLDEAHQVWVVTFELDTNVDPGIVMIEVGTVSGNAAFFHHF